MSQIFDALRRSESERSGTAVAELSAATELLEAAERQVGQLTAENASPPATEQQPENKLLTPRLATDPFNQFKSVRAMVAPQSRLVSITAEESLAAEKFRFLAVRLRHIQQKRPLRRLLVTSSMPEEGKSTVSANLACALAKKQSQKVLLLEGDLRCPSLSQQFGLGMLPGLSELLREATPAKINIYQLEGLNLWILPAGSPSHDPLELMQSEQLSLLLDQMSGWFDWIVIDSPPVLPLADTSVWMRMSDAILLVTRPGKTAKQQLRRALEAIEQPKLLGALLNGSREAALGDYYHYYASRTAAPTIDIQHHPNRYSPTPAPTDSSPAISLTP